MSTNRFALVTVVTVVDIANAFAKHFSSVYYNSVSDFNAVDAFLNLHADCKSKVNVRSDDTASSFGVFIIYHSVSLSSI